jgi:hypothetical protein
MEYKELPLGNGSKVFLTHWCGTSPLFRRLQGAGHSSARSRFSGSRAYALRRQDIRIFWIVRPSTGAALGMLFRPYIWASIARCSLGQGRCAPARRWPRAAILDCRSAPRCCPCRSGRRDGRLLSNKGMFDTLGGMPAISPHRMPLLRPCQSGCHRPRSGLKTGKVIDCGTRPGRC